MNFYIAKRDDDLYRVEFYSEKHFQFAAFSDLEGLDGLVFSDDLPMKQIFRRPVDAEEVIDLLI